ncbi:uncharacterized protein [Miscanthus floridulus]|uniref:uncharacterized protein isoform X5 n=1 Tax=Miscanthus floridulus TaxID=154761 RepID=UPI0034578095
MPDGSGSGRDYGRGIGGRRLAVTLRQQQLLPRNPASATITAASEKRNSTASYAGCNSRMAATKAASQFVAPLQVATPYFLIATKPEAPSMLQKYWFSIVTHLSSYLDDAGNKYLGDQ